MQAFGGAVALVLLCTLLQVNPAPVTEQGVSTKQGVSTTQGVSKIQVLRELQYALEKMKDGGCEETLYTPTDVMEQCSRATLNCFLEELKTAISCKKEHEIENVMENFRTPVSFLNGTLPQTNTSCVQCEYYEKKPFQSYRDEFLNFSKQLMTWLS